METALNFGDQAKVQGPSVLAKRLVNKVDGLVRMNPGSNCKFLGGSNRDHRQSEIRSLVFRACDAL